MQTTQKKVFQLLVDNTSGVLSRISGLFSRRGYNIESITAGVTADPRLTRITIVTSGDDEILEQIEKQVGKLVDVRDIRELKLMKIATRDGHSRYAVFQNPDRELASRYIHVLKTAFVSMDTAQNLLVIKTVSGMAMAAAAALDDMNWSEIVGCIAGDNTIMCAARNSDEALLAMAKLKKMLEEDSGS